MDGSSVPAAIHVRSRGGKERRKGYLPPINLNHEVDWHAIVVGTVGN